MPTASRPLPVLVTGVFLLTVAVMGCAPASPAEDPDDETWVSLFNGRDLANWIPKIAGQDVGEDPARTFRVEDGLLSVRYDGYGAFDDQFGHLFFDRPYSHYRLAVEYRFVGEQQTGGPDWARRNSGVMLHSQDPRTMGRDQDFPISVEVQFLGGLGDGRDRPTANVCTPGTEIVLDGRQAPTHCVSSRSETFDGDRWVRAEALVLGDSLIVHIVGPDTVLRYTDLSIGGGTVNGYDPAAKPDGAPLAGGYIALQSESHPIDFRVVELLDLTGCADQDALNFKRYVVASDPAACRFPGDREPG